MPKRKINIRIVFSNNSKKSDKPVKKKVKKSKESLKICPKHINDVILPDDTLLYYFDDIIKKHYTICNGSVSEEWKSFLTNIKEEMGSKGLYQIFSLIKDFQSKYGFNFRISNSYIPQFIDRYYENMIHYGMNDASALDQAFKETFNDNCDYHSYILRKIR